jgi:flavin reductase (DIM6/NTAB) family NADH-FMN oxidoreductase RutF
MGRRRKCAPRSEFGKFLDHELAQRGLGPVQFAERSGLSLSHVYQLLRGDRADPRGTTFSKAAAALGMTEASLAQAVFPHTAAGTASAASGAPGGSAQPGWQAEPHETGPRLEKATFFAIMSAFPSGVTIVSTLDEDSRPKGLTCTALCSLSADPPLLLVCVDKKSNTLPALRHSRQFVVNYLLAGRGDLANRFATREADRWTHVAWRPTTNGLPWLHADCLAYAECSVVQDMDGGDHVIIVGRVDGGQSPAPGTHPLMYFRRNYGTWRD